MFDIKDMLLTNHNRPKKKIIKLKGIVIHYTGNYDKGADAKANRNYFNGTNDAVSAHYIADDKTIIRCVPDDEIAYHVGAKSYTSIGQKIREGSYTPNYFLIGIEMCVNSDGDWKKTYQNTVELAAYLLQKYKLTVLDLYRHYDITGKICPAMMINEADWNVFREAVKKKMDRPVLRIGSKGEEVRELQENLIKLGYDLGKWGADGDFGNATYEAVKKLQKDHGLEDDGVVGKNTYALLDRLLNQSQTSQPQDNPYPTIRLGDKGELVRLLQEKLNRKGYNLKVDGDFGGKTETAVKDYQKKNGLTSDGVVGPKTWAKLYDANNMPTTKYYIEGITHVVEVDPMTLRISIQDMAANNIKLNNFVTSGFQMLQAEKTSLPIFPTSREIIQKGKYLTYPLGILVSEGCIIQNRQPHGKPTGTLIVYKDGRVECKPVLNLITETDYQNIWFAVSGCSILPAIRMNEEGFVGTFADIGRICPRPVIGYRKKDNKIVIAVRKDSNISRGQLTLKNLGCDFGITLDAGGSTVLKVNEEYKFKTTRRLFSVITW